MNIPFFGKKKTITAIKPKFHHEANLFGEHGRMVVTHRSKGLTEQSVAFVFPGLTTPPKMDLVLMSFLWEEAQNQGFIPHHIASYGCDNAVIGCKGQLTTQDGTTAPTASFANRDYDAPAVWRQPHADIDLPVAMRNEAARVIDSARQ